MFAGGLAFHQGKARLGSCRVFSALQLVPVANLRSISCPDILQREKERASVYDDGLY